MEPKLNLELIELYCRTTRTTGDIYRTLVEQFIQRLDDCRIEILPTISPVLLGMIAVCTPQSNRSVTMHQVEGKIVAAVYLDGDELLTLAFSDNTIMVNHPDNGVVIATNLIDLDSALLPTIIENAGEWNAHPERVKQALNYLDEVQTLVNPGRDIDIVTILKAKKQELLDGVRHYSNILSLYQPYTPEEDIVESMEYTDEQYQHNLNAQYIEEKIESGCSQTTLDANATENQQRAKTYSNVAAVAFSEELMRMALVVKEQTTNNVNIRNIDGRVEFTCGQGKDTVLWALCTAPGEAASVYFMRPATSDILNKQYIDTTTQQSMIKSFIDVIDSNVSGAVIDGGRDTQTELEQFIRIVLNILISGADVKDVHLPTETVPEDDHIKQTTIKVNKIADEHLEDVTNAFNRDKHVVLLDSINYTAHRVVVDPVADSGDCPDFISLIAKMYALDIVYNPKAHNPVTLQNFVRSNIGTFVSVNWDKTILSTMNPLALRNKQNWVTTYGCDAIVDRVIVQRHPRVQLDIGEVDSDNTLIIPASNITVDIRNHLNNNQVLGDVPYGVTKLTHKSVGGKVTNYRYVRIPVDINHQGGDTLVVYIEMTSELIRIIPIYTDSQTNKVDSLNVFVSIREIDWPQILLYLDMVLNQMVDDSDGVK